MVLDIDVGNSRIKWRAGGQPGIAAGSCAREDLAALLGPGLETVPTRIRVASVADAAFNEALRGKLRARFAVEPEFARTPARAAGLSCAYERPETMGVDRWLALLAAWSRTREATLVVDAGTAVTVDAASPQGRHLGGYIVPGLELMRRSLGTDTAEVKVTGAFEASAAGLAFGRSTGEAVRHGLLRMLLALIEASSDGVREEFGTPPHLYLCGGDAAFLAACLSRPHVLAETLVLDGLEIAMP